MLTWPQNARNPISKDFNFKIFPGEGLMPMDPPEGDHLCWSVSLAHFSKILYPPATSGQMEATVFKISFKYFCSTRALLKIRISLAYSPILAGSY